MSNPTKLSLIVALSLCLLASNSVCTRAQETYKSDALDAAFVMPDASKFDKTKKDQKTEYANLEKAAKAARGASRESADNVLRGTVDLNTAKAEFDRYFNGLLFPSMTQTDDDSLSKLGDQRDDLLKAIKETPSDSPTRRHLVDELTMPFFSRVLADAAYHPAVRTNAIIILSEMNQREGQRGVEPAIPSPAALRILLDTAIAADSPNYLKICALKGILRHATIDGQMQTPFMDNGMRQQCIDLAIAILNSNAADPAVPLSDEQYWMHRQAVQILGAFRNPGADGKVVAALRKILDNQEASLMLALDAIEAYGNLRFTSREQADVANVAKSVGLVVSKALKSDVQMIDNYVNSIKNNQLIAKRANATSTTQSGQAAPDEGGTTSAAAGGGVGKKGSGGGAATAAAAGTSGTTSAVQLPNYKINDVRQSSKYIAFVARRALDGLAPRRKNEVKQPENLKAQADPATAKVIEQMVAALDKLMEETDLATPKTPAVNPALLTTEGQKKPESIDERLRNSLKTGINAIELAIGIAPANQPPAVRSAVGSQ